MPGHVVWEHASDSLPVLSHSFAMVLGPSTSLPAVQEPRGGGRPTRSKPRNQKGAFHSPFFLPSDRIFRVSIPPFPHRVDWTRPTSSIRFHFPSTWTCSRAPASASFSASDMATIAIMRAAAAPTRTLARATASRSGKVRRATRRRSEAVHDASLTVGRARATPRGAVSMAVDATGMCSTTCHGAGPEATQPGAIVPRCT
eukprot:scaffold2549_cov333-Pavlova_lutheri.AAC.3